MRMNIWKKSGIPLVAAVLLWACQTAPAKAAQTVAILSGESQSEASALIESQAESASAQETPYTDEELCQLARTYYETRHNYSPQSVAVDFTDGDMVVIRLYDSFEDHRATSDLYRVNRYTAQGENVLGEAVDLKNP